jgi:hypothetical protein
MSPLLRKLMLICGNGTALIERMEIDQNFAVVRRSEKELARDRTFRLKDHYTSRDVQAPFEAAQPLILRRESSGYAQSLAQSRQRVDH